MKKNTEFQKKKILSLNSFFMKNVGLGGLFLIIIYVISFLLLFYLINNSDIDNGLRISIISMSATFILTTSKTLIEKIIAIINYAISLLGSEQQGLNKSIGIEMDKVELENVEIEDDENL